MTIHTDHPFALPEDARDQLRRFRGRLGGQVSLWTTGEGTGRRGLTVSSLMVGLGEPGSALGLLDPDSDFAAALSVGTALTVQLLDWRHRDLAEQFAGEMPAPGGLFAKVQMEQTPYGPRLLDAGTWLACRVSDLREVGWSLLVSAEVEQVSLVEDHEPLQHRRGRYARPQSGGPHSSPRDMA